MIPILNLTRQYEQLKTEIDEALIRVASSGHFILGPEVQQFEAEIASFLNVKHVISCANGTDALFLALKALGIGEGAEVITSPFSFVATSEAIVRAGAKPVFTDIDPDTLNMDIQHLESLISPNTRAILPVHIFGQPANMTEILRFSKAHGLRVVEDCAQAIGADFKGIPVGTIGDIGCFSFFPSKNLGAMGDAGMCTTNDDALAERLRMLRVHGSRQRYFHDEPGINSRLDELQAAVLRVKLPHLAQWNQSRQKVAHLYDQLLAPLSNFLETPFVHPDGQHVFHQYTFQLKSLEKITGINIPDKKGAEQSAVTELRIQLQKPLQAAGVQTMIYYPVPLYRQRTHADLKLNPADYPVCEAVSNCVLSLPMFPELREDEQEEVVQSMSKALEPLFAQV